jgi:hypothetical protein
LVGRSSTLAAAPHARHSQVPVPNVEAHASVASPLALPEYRAAFHRGRFNVHHKPKRFNLWLPVSRDFTIVRQAIFMLSCALLLLVVGACSGPVPSDELEADFHAADESEFDNEFENDVELGAIYQEIELVRVAERVRVATPTPAYRCGAGGCICAEGENVPADHNWECAGMKQACQARGFVLEFPCRMLSGGIMVCLCRPPGSPGSGSGGPSYVP